MDDTTEMDAGKVYKININGRIYQLNSKGPLCIDRIGRDGKIKRNFYSFFEIPEPDRSLLVGCLKAKRDKAKIEIDPQSH